MPNIESSAEDIETPITEDGSNNAESVAVEDDVNSSSFNDIMDVDGPVPILTSSEESNLEHSSIKPSIKSEPMDNSADLLLDDELRLQIEKNIELVVNEFSRSADCITESVTWSDETTENQVSDSNSTDSAPAVEQTDGTSVGNDDVSTIVENESNSAVSSSCTKDSVAESHPKIPDDIIVIPLSGQKTINVKSEPRDSTAEAIKFKKCDESSSACNKNNPVSSKGIYLHSLTSGKHSSLTIVPVTSGSTPVKYVLPDSVITKTKIRSESGEFSLSADVTIKSVPSSSTSNPSLSTSKGNPCTSINLSKLTFGNEMNIPISSHGARSNSLPNDYLGLPITPPQMFLDHGMKSDTSSSFSPCSTFNSKYCSYKPPNTATSNSMSDVSSFSYPPSPYLSKSCNVPHSMPGSSTALTQCQQSSSLALMPYSSQSSSFCANFNSFAQTPSPLSSPKHLKPPINALNSCRMSSSSPIPAYMRSREPSYSAPIPCDTFSAGGIVPAENVSFRSTPAWNAPLSSSFRSPTSPATFNFTLPSSNMRPIAPPPPPHSAPSSTSAFPSCTNQLPPSSLPHHQKYAQNSGYPFGSNLTPGFSSNSPHQRAQCCFSSQLQCFNSACASGSQQQFSIVQHSTRLSNLKSNSIDSMSSLLQCHTYFKKY